MTDNYINMLKYANLRILGFILSVFWIVFIRDTPEKSKRISDEEKKYILDNIPIKDESTDSLKKTKIPWKGILTSVPVYAIIVVLFASDWAFLFMGTFVPTYLDDVFHFNSQNVSIHI
ncbi:hypothetical protein KUTeg_000512 [Tegillarca granosa]|uniref:Uncharacterized protein n=1 Tax=Tegillarca granosa TaxID=220873 RepID=A0ABQ9FXS1_TEGGR|nr:hypothetical protein KUTeg_000512 [Tegillarca granosa]